MIDSDFIVSLARWLCSQYEFKKSSPNNLRGKLEHLELLVKLFRLLHDLHGEGLASQLLHKGRGPFRPRLTWGSLSAPEAESKAWIDHSVGSLTNHLAPIAPELMLGTVSVFQKPKKIQILPLLLRAPYDANPKP